MKRVVLAGFQHESAAWSHVPADARAFRTIAGDALLADGPGVPEELAGARERLRQDGLEPIGGVYAGATPSGPITPDVYEAFVHALRECLRQSGADGLLLALHGSATVSGRFDAQGDLLEAIRRVVGPALPIVATFDLHAMPSRRLLERVDAVVSYRTAPHRDQRDTGIRAAAMLAAILRDGRRPGLWWTQLPLLLPGEFGQTDRAPMADVMAMARAIEVRHGLDAVSVLQGYPWADGPDAGASVLAVGRPSAAAPAADLTALALEWWARREQLYQATPVMPVDAMLAAAAPRLAHGTLTYLLDAGDNPTAGADADDARLIPPLLATGLPAVLGAVADASLVKAARQAGIGGWIDGAVGGEPSGRPAVRRRLQGRVVALGCHQEGGATTAVAAGPLTVLVSSRRMGIRTPQDLVGLGVDPRDGHRLVVLKSGYLFPALADLLAGIPGAAAYLLRTPGASSLDLTTFPYTQVPRPVYPLDPDVVWEPVLWRREPLPRASWEVV
jgi:microcystin degradation protein MlrC